MSDILHKSSGFLTVKLGWAYRLNLPDDCEQWRPYAVGEYEGFQESTEAETVYSESKSVSWIAWHQPLRFEVFMSPSTDLIVSLYARPKLSCERCESQVISLGFIRLNPFLFEPGMQKVDIQNGAGGMEIEVSFAQREPSFLEAREVWNILGENSAGLICVKKEDTGRSYGMEVIDRVGTAVDIVTLSSAIQHPFIAPLKFAFMSDGQLKLLSPLGSGGYLFDHLQHERVFDVHKAKYYAAELVCILEYLHSKNVILGSLEAENILLDSVGHANLCKPGIYGVELGDRDCICPGTPQYPAPEAVLTNQKPSRTGNWWALGLILYEMLTGIPPFYHKDNSERRRKIIHEELHLPENLPSTAKEIVTSLLETDPTRRLGANGVAEVKDHLFFHDVNWDKCIQADYATPFKPQDDAVHFRGKRHKAKPSKSSKNEFREHEGKVYEQLGTDEWPLWAQRGQVVDKNASSSPKTRESEQWKLESDPAGTEFYFKNCLTGERVLAKPESYMGMTIGQVFPSERKQEAALAAALEAGYSKQVFSQLLTYGVDLNVRILDYDETINTMTPEGIVYKPDNLNLIPVTPLEWAVEHGRLDLVNLFLENGADANFTVTPRHGPALVKAVKCKSQELVKILVRKTDRVSCTRALAWAVEQGDITTANSLLANGVRCDFEEADRPPPLHPFHYDNDSLLYRPLEAEDLTPPLVRAARLGNLPMVSLLLEHGADANTAYHDLGGRHENETDTRDSIIPAYFSCGRAVQIAMEMGRTEVVQQLIDAGADIDMKHQFWPVLGHICLAAPRSVYLEVRAGLEAVVAEKRTTSH